MAYTTGTASHQSDLLHRLRLYLISQGWTVLNWIAPSSAVTEGVLQVRGPGAGTGREVFVNIYSTFDTSAAAYGWRIRGATGYVAGAPEGSQPGEQQSASWFNTWDSAIDYWFYVNDRRFIVVAKVSTSYTACYAGFFLPFAQPSQFPFPLFVGADFNALTPWTNTPSHRRVFFDPGGVSVSGADSSTFWRNWIGQWQGCINHLSGPSNDLGALGSPGQSAVWPYRGDHFANSGIDNRAWASTRNGTALGSSMDALVPTRQNERWVWPCMIINMAHAPPGVLDGVSAVMGRGLSSEQIVSAGGKTYRAFQNINRTSGNDFFVVEEA